MGLAALIFATALAVRRRIAAAASVGWWLRLTAIAIVSGTLIGWTVENVPLESLTVGDWLRSLAWACRSAHGAGGRRRRPGIGGERAELRANSRSRRANARAIWWRFRSASS